jgi:tRNA G18 (ribose-2'-O)-methylase SpoU
VVIHVADLSDPRVADYRNVPDPELLRARGVFVAEGRHVVRRLLASPRFRTRSLLLTESALASLADLTQRVGDLPVFVVSQDAMNAIAGFNIHRGCLAIGERPAPLVWTDLVDDARLVLVLERIANADNVGGIFRNAAAFGADAVLLGPACTDPLYRKAIRTSMGAALRVPFAAIEEWPTDLARLRSSGFRILALTPAADAEPLAKCPRSTRRTPRGDAWPRGRRALCGSRCGRGCARANPDGRGRRFAERGGKRGRGAVRDPRAGAVKGSGTISQVDMNEREVR